jgi:hypothetical protein
MEEAENRLLSHCTTDTRFLRTAEHRKATTKPEAHETVRCYVFLVGAAFPLRSGHNQHRSYYSRTMAW